MGYRDRNFSFYPLMHSKYLYSKLILLYWASQVVLVVKNQPTNAGDLSNMDGEDTLKEGVATHSSIFAWRILWTEEPGGLQSIGSQRVSLLK